MRQALAALVELVEAERGFLVLYDGFEVQERLFVGADPDADAFSSGVAEQVLWTGQPVFVEDASQHADLAGRESIQALALRAVVGLPLSVDGQVIGVMIADSRQIKQGWGEAEMEVALALAQAVAMAIAHARQADADARELERLRLVQRVALAIAGEREPARLAELVLAEARALVDAERGFLLLGSDADRLRLPDGSPPVDTSQSVCRWVLEQREPLHSLDVQSDDAFANAQSVMALGLRTVVGVPVCAGETCFGLMYLDSRRMGSADPRALASLSALGELLGAHLAPSTPASPAHGN
jgi:GAF domain-containing protein